MGKTEKLTYLGHGFIAGIPARDLEGDEIEKYGKERLLNSGLYRDDTPLSYDDEVEAMTEELEMIEETFEEDD